MKFCKGCELYKPIVEFHKCRAKKDGVKHRCKFCVSEYNSRYAKSNSEKLSKYKKKYRSINLEKLTRINKEWRLENKDFIKDQGKKYRVKNKETLLEKNRSYRIKNRDKVNAYHSKYRRERNAVDINYRLRNNLRSRLAMAIKNNQKSGSAVRDLGCSIEHLKNHLGLLFLPQMSWDNYGKGGWSIDHILPLCAFDLTDVEQFKKACHYTNLQPMWEVENSSKGGRTI